MCTKRRPILSRYEGIYKSLIHQHSELKKRKHANPHPKRPDFVHYRDLKGQNEWIRENCFDPMGNYLFCCSCIRASLKISKQRIAHQRAIKQQESQEPLRDVTKAEVEEQCLSAYVIMPAALEVAFKEWWQSLKSSDVITIRYPHACHSNTGRKSNSSTHAKTS